MPDQIPAHPNIASVEQRVEAIEAAFDERGLKAGEVHRGVPAHRR